MSRFTVRRGSKGIKFWGEERDTFLVLSMKEDTTCYKTPHTSHITHQTPNKKK